MKKKIVILVASLMLIGLTSCSLIMGVSTLIMPPDSSTSPSSNIASTEIVLTTMDEKVQYIEPQVAALIETQKLTGAYYVVYSNDGETLWIQIFIDQESDLAQKIAGFEQEFSINSVLGADSQKEWSAWTEAFRKLAFQITNDVHHKTSFQFGGIDDRVLFQIVDGEDVIDSLSKK